MSDTPPKYVTRVKWLIRLFFSGAVFISILIISVVAIAFWPLSVNAKAQRALELARLADLPASATAIKADGTSNLFTMTYLLRFEASVEDIEQFLAGSPGLHDLAPTDIASDPFIGGYSDSRYPWFDPPVDGPGRYFAIPQDSDACHGELWIDDETHTVFVVASRS